MAFSIRDALTEDAAMINRLSIQLGYPISETATSQNLKAILQNEDEIVYVALHEKEMIGWIHIFYTLRLESGSFCEIGGLVVAEKYRNKGVGRMLIEQAKLWCISRKILSLRLRSNVKRLRAHEFFLHLGFRQTKQQNVFEISIPGE